MPVHSESDLRAVTSWYGPGISAGEYGGGSVPVTVLAGPVTGPQQGWGSGKRVEQSLTRMRRAAFTFSRQLILSGEMHI